MQGWELKFIQKINLLLLSTLNHDLWIPGSNLRFGPFTGTGSTDVIYANLKTYNTNVTTGIYGIRWIVEEYDVAPTTMS